MIQILRRINITVQRLVRHSKCLRPRASDDDICQVELLLKKSDSRSWTVLERTAQNVGNISLTFGVGGRTGTIGGKELVLDESNRIRA